MTTALLRWIILICWVFWLLTYWLSPYIFRQMHKSTVLVAKSLRDLITLVLLILSLTVILFSVVMMTLSNTFSPYSVEPWLGWIGLLFVMLGLAGMYWSRFSMGKLWLPETGLKHEHRVINSGLFGTVRHPIYTAAIIFCLGSVLVFSTWWTWAALLGAVIGYMRKVLEEEAFLVEHLPGYLEYQHQVHYRLIPGVW